MITDFEVINKRYIWDLVKFKVIKFDRVTVNFLKAEELSFIDVLNLNVDSHNG